MKERREREREESKIKREEWERNAETIDRKKQTKNYEEIELKENRSACNNLTTSTRRDYTLGNG